VRIDDWFLTAAERGNPATTLDSRHPDWPAGQAWSTGNERVAVYSPENEAGTPICVHAKVCVVDDTWSIVGSDNFNRRSWTHYSELS
jgi:phosphatidylserine/phosphatidylglycerophosphate/cardiolipin synthase-like enzyme